MGVQQKASLAKPIGVVGQGPWMEMLADLARTHGRNVMVWPRDDSADLGEGIEAEADPAALCSACRLILMATTFDALPQMCQALGEHLQGHHRVVHTLQGLDPHGGNRASAIISELTPVRQVGALVGPIYPEMYLEGKPCGAIISSEFPTIIKELQGWMSSPRLRLYGSYDIIGVEVAAAAVRPIAMAFGLMDVLSLGSSARGMLMARGVAEMARLVELFGGKSKSAFGMAGLGALATQIESPGASSYQIGRMLAAGEKLDTIKARFGGRATDLAETSRLLSTRALDEGIKAHIVHAASRILTGELDTSGAIRELFALGQMME